MTDPYVPRRPARGERLRARGLEHHLHVWGPASGDAARPPLVMLHGWMDIGASFQFVVDAFRDERPVVAPDLRGFGLTEAPAGTDAYWFPDYLGDLDALLDARWPNEPVDLLGHSMGGNVATMYAGIRPGRVRRLVNLEGFGLPDTRPAQAPGRYAEWLDELKEPAVLRDYDSLDAVAARLRKTNPLIRPDRARWLAGRWSEEVPGGRRRLLADPAHRRLNPVLWRKEEALACWKRIAAPVLWVDGDRSDVMVRWGDGYPPDELESRLKAIPRLVRHRLSPAGHMLHHDQPEALAERIEHFLDGPEPE